MRMKTYEEIVKNRTPQQNEEVLNHVIKNDLYKGWESTYVGGGSTVFSKRGHEDIKAYRGLDCVDWTLDTWLECKDKIDSIEG